MVLRQATNVPRESEFQSAIQREVNKNSTVLIHLNYCYQNPDLTTDNMCLALGTFVWFSTSNLFIFFICNKCFKSFIFLDYIAAFSSCSLVAQHIPSSVLKIVLGFFLWQIQWNQLIDLLLCLFCWLAFLGELTRVWTGNGIGVLAGVVFFLAGYLEMRSFMRVVILEGIYDFTIGGGDMWYCLTLGKMVLREKCQFFL